jgi:hypothetical protein
VKGSHAIELSPSRPKLLSEHVHFSLNVRHPRPHRLPTRFQLAALQSQARGVNKANNGTACSLLWDGQDPAKGLLNGACRKTVALLHVKVEKLAVGLARHGDFVGLKVAMSVGTSAVATANKDA